MSLTTWHMQPMQEGLIIGHVRSRENISFVSFFVRGYGCNLLDVFKKAISQDFPTIVVVQTTAGGTCLLPSIRERTYGGLEICTAEVTSVEISCFMLPTKGIIYPSVHRVSLKFLLFLPISTILRNCQNQHTT